MFFTFIGVISAILLLCTIICGLWIKLNNRNNDSNSHFTFQYFQLLFTVNCGGLFSKKLMSLLCWGLLL